MPSPFPCVSRVCRVSRVFRVFPVSPSHLLALPFTLALVLSLAPETRAQWQTPDYHLRGGWNSIYLHGDATHATIDQLVAANPEIVSIWRWNPSPNQTQFTTSPLIPNPGIPEWQVWVRGQPTQSTLGALSGQAAYLVECTGTAADSYMFSIPQRIQLPRSTWVRNGANFLGFPSQLNGTFPFFSAYFATFPAAIAANSRIYKYVGGPLGPNNPVQVFSPATEPLDRTRAYWFEAPVVGNFYAPLEISLTNPKGLQFGRTGALITVRVRNRTNAPITLTLTPANSAGAPGGQTPIVGAVPLTRRTFDSATASYTNTAVTTAFNEVVGPQATVELSFGVDRAAMTAPSGSLYASFLRLTDSGNLADISLPASALVPTLAGLWIGDVAVERVESKVPGSAGTTTRRPFPLRIILHVDDSGTARLLSQAFLGQLAAAPHPIGLSTRESALKADALGKATRFAVAHLPPDTEATSGSGSVALGATLVRTVSIPFNAPTNPFVHTYHPDHDNKNARFDPIGPGIESPEIARSLTFTFASTPLPTSTALGWGSTILGGTYSETVTGLHRTTITATGTFELRRVSELGAITLN